MKRSIYSLFSLLALATLLSNCTRSPYRAANQSYKRQAKTLAKEIRRNPGGQTLATAPEWVGTTNFNLRKPNLVIIHHTAQKSCEETLNTFTRTQSQVSAHYVICKDGIVHHMLNDYLRAWHGGVGRWGSVTDLNSASIGIEIDNNGFEPFTEAQVTNLLVLLDTLKSKYSIPTANFIGHSDVAPTRKVDPNVTFPWKTLADRGFGHWWSDTTGVAVPEGFNPMDALRIIGYDVRDSVATIQAFKRKFLQLDKSGELTEGDRKVLFTLYRRYL
ncbi:MAG TPA: N-acetylmuramoyl-L-alanine amidase [Chitinophagaceae bacterium]